MNRYVSMLMRELIIVSQDGDYTWFGQKMKMKDTFL